MAVELAPQNVLVIEDDRDLADSLRDVLLLGNHRVEVAYDGLEGMERATRCKPDILFCDLGLPGLDGYGVARAFRSRPDLCSTFLIALSGYAQPIDVQGAHAAGFDIHIAKPARVEEINRAMLRPPRPFGPTTGTCHGLKTTSGWPTILGCF